MPRKSQSGITCKVFSKISKNITTGIAVAHGRGIILYTAEKLQIPIYEYTPLQIKQALVGYGRAEKKQVQLMVKTMLDLEKIPKPDDTADALACAICHAHSRNAVKKELKIRKGI